MKAFGAKIVLTPANLGPIGAVQKRDELAKEIKNSWIPGQFENQDNPMAHEETTGAEIIRQTKGKIDAFVAGVGTGGTLMGVASALKKAGIKAKIIAVEPKESALLSGGKSGIHNIQGIGENFVPVIINRKLIDTIENVSTREAVSMVKKLAREQGILAGISAGANMVASLRMAKQLEEGKVVVTVLPDRGERYLSEGIFD